MIEKIIDTILPETIIPVVSDSANATYLCRLNKQIFYMLSVQTYLQSNENHKIKRHQTLNTCSSFERSVVYRFIMDLS